MTSAVVFGLLVSTLLLPAAAQAQTSPQSGQRTETIA